MTNKFKITRIQDLKVEKYTENEIINTTVDYIGSVFGGVRNPSKIKSNDLSHLIYNDKSELEEMREVASALIYVYPAMFMQSGKEGSLDGYHGSKPKLSLKDLAQKMKFRVIRSK